LYPPQVRKPAACPRFTIVYKVRYSRIQDCLDRTIHHRHGKNIMVRMGTVKQQGEGTSLHRSRPSSRTAFALICTVIACIPALVAIALSNPFRRKWILWAAVQYLPWTWRLRTTVQEAAWQASSSPLLWDNIQNTNQEEEGEHQQGQRQQQPRTRNETVPSVDVQAHRNNLTGFLESTYGRDWRARPLLLKGLWTLDELRDRNRRLTLDGLLKENLTVPYFSDARVRHALTPDRAAPIQDIVHNISRNGMPHKIGTQLFVQTYPDLVVEVAPSDIVTELFGPYFTPNHVRGSGPFHRFPALTTVPLFVASGGRRGRSDQEQQQQQRASDATPGATHSYTKKSSAPLTPYTALHCEPIGNVAVQLSGQKQWTLVRPEYWMELRPSAAPDGRAYFASWVAGGGDSHHSVPSYTVITEAGDAVWVPTWTWHRVDYIESEEISISGSLFHFRGFDFVYNNPLFAIMILPAILLELVGYKTQ
jgi:hypothetical protein